ncbi:hypothetical protein R84B8_01465 [Treponema sp. R8-4-B8]
MAESNDIEDFPYYKELDKNQFYAIYKDFVADVKKILDLLKIDRKDVYVVSPAISNTPVKILVGRVEKRKIYFHIFHRLKMDELNDAAFYCFWILKLQPFKHKDENYDNHSLNVHIALFFLLQVACKYAKQQNYTIGITSKGINNFSVDLVF